MNIWIMKTFKDWARRFVVESNPTYIAIDEQGVDEDYGKLSKKEKEKLFEKVAKNSVKSRQWGRIKNFFDKFYDDIQIGDLLVVGVGQTTKFNIAAIVRIESEPYYFKAPDSDYSRHRRNVKVIWQGDPVEFRNWGWANRLEKIDSKQRLEEFIKIYTDLTIEG